MKLQGHIVEIKARVMASSDITQRVTLELHGDFALLHALQGKTVQVTIEEITQ
jgi:hypothetical protein